jgi:hypothetical protein
MILFVLIAPVAVLYAVGNPSRCKIPLAIFVLGAGLFAIGFAYLPKHAQY